MTNDYGKLLIPGNVVRISFKNSDPIKGTVCSYETTFSMLVLKSPTQDYSGSQKLFDVSVINMAHVVDVQRISDATKPEPHPVVDPAAVNNRLRDTLNRRKQRIAGPQSPENCLRVYDKLRAQFGHKVKIGTDRKTIIFMDNVQIVEPYKPENCQVLGHGGKSTSGDTKNDKTLDFAKVNVKNAWASISGGTLSASSSAATLAATEGAG